MIVLAFLSCGPFVVIGLMGGREEEDLAGLWGSWVVGSLGDYFVGWQWADKAFRTEFVLKSLDCIVFFAKEVHLFREEGGKEKGHLGEPRDRRGRGIWGCGGTSSSSTGTGVKASPREPLGRPPSVSLKKAVCCQQSTVR